MKHFLKLNRYHDDGVRALGVLTLVDGKDEIFKCQTIERPWLNNEPFKSCIPPGKYDCFIRYSKKFKKHIQINGVDGRTNILIHPGNKVEDVTGCIAVGEIKESINYDFDKVDYILGNSRVTLNRLIAHLEEIIPGFSNNKSTVQLVVIKDMVPYQKETWSLETIYGIRAMCFDFDSISYKDSRHLT